MHILIQDQVWVSPQQEQVRSNICSPRTEALESQDIPKKHGFKTHATSHLRTGWDTTPEREIGRSQDLDLETISTTWVITAYPGENPGTLHSNKGWYRQVTELCLTLCNPWTICRLPGSFVHGILQARIRGVGICFLLQGIFPTQGSNPGLMHCRQILFVWANQTKNQAVNA